MTLSKEESFCILRVRANQEEHRHKLNYEGAAVLVYPVPRVYLLPSGNVQVVCPICKDHYLKTERDLAEKIEDEDTNLSDIEVVPTSTEENLIREAIEKYGKVSATFLQTKINVSYDRASELIKKYNNKTI